MSRRPLVLLSARLGAVTAVDRRLEAVGATIRSAPLGSPADIETHARDADLVILGAVEPFDRVALARLPRLGAIVRRGVGYDNVDVAAATEAGILVANVPDASVDEVSDHALALLLALERRLVPVDALVRSGAAVDEPAAIHEVRLRSRRLAHLTLGVVGFGRIGRALVRKALAIYGRVLVHDVVQPGPERLAGASFVSLSTLLQESDHVSLHLPMTSQNQHLIGADHFATMRPGAVLVNTARGGLVDEGALIAALKSGQLGAAALDVTEREPISSSDRLMADDLRDRLLLTGHSAAWSDAAEKALVSGSVDAAFEILSGRAPPTLLNPEVLVSPALRMRSLATASGPAPSASSRPSAQTTRSRGE